MAFTHANAFITAQQEVGSKEVDIATLAREIRKDGRECGWENGPDDDEETAVWKDTSRLMFTNFLAGMIEEPLEQAPRYVTASMEFPDMTISVAAHRPGGSSPLSEHENIRHMCRRVGWDPDRMSLFEFVGTLVHASKHVR